MVKHSLKDKVICITGSAIRVGRLMAEGLVDAQLILHYNQSEQEAFELKKILEKKNARFSIFKADFKVPKEIHNLFDFVEKKYGHLDILINSASTYEKIDFDKIKDFDSALDVNLKAPIIASQRASKIMREKSLIINVCDTFSLQVKKGFCMHSISKAALFHATKAMALELAPHTRVCNLLIGAALKSKNQDEKDYQNILECRVLKQRALTSQELVSAIKFMIENEYVNGSTLSLDGGWVY